MSTRLAFRRALNRIVFGIAAASVAGPLAAANGSWSTTGPYGGSVRLVTVYEASPSTLWAAGNGGVFRSTSSGASWDRVEIGLPAATPIQDFVAASATPVLYLTNGQRIYRSGNGGDLWVTLGSLPTSGYVSDLSLRRATSNSIAVATHDGAYVSSNGGGSWTGPGAGGTSARFSKIEYAADGSLYLGIEYSDPGAFGGAVLLKSTNAGASWTPLATQPPGMFGIALLASSPSDPQRIFATDGYTIATSSDGGTSWAGISQPGTGAGCNQLLSLTPHPTQPLALFVGCSNNGVHFTTNVSAPVWTSWTAASGLSVNGNDPVQSASIAVHPAYATTPTVFVGASDGGLFRSTNAGAAWTVINQGYQSANIRALATHPRDTSNAIVLAGYGDAFTTSRAIYKSPNSGITWDPSTDGLKAEQIRSISIDPTTVDTDPFTAENFTVYAAGRSERLPTIADKDGGIYKSSDAGANWTTIDNGIAMVSGVRDMGTVRTIALDPRSCAAPPASGPCAIGSGPLQTLFAAGGGRVDFSGSGLPYLSARIYKSTNAGTTWSPSETGLPLSQDLGPAGQSNYAYMGGIVPLVFDPSNTQTIYIGSFLAWSPGIAGAAEPTIANGVFKSTNGGASWIHASEGLPRYAGVASSHRDVLALAINPANPQVLYAGAVDLYSSPLIGRVYKTINGGATWSESSTGISGQDVRALFIDPADPSGDTIYAGTGGDGANPGGVYRSTNGGATWNSFSLGLPAYAATALAMPARAPGAAARILAGTNSGVWDYTAVPDEDADGVPSAMENSVLGGDGNGDGILDSQQSNVASFAALASTSGTQPNALTGTQVNATVSIVPGSCTQLNDISSLQANLFPPDPVGDVTSHDPWGLVSFSLPGCSAATVRVTFHGASFGPGWTWRNYGPRIPGDDASFGWYTFAGARRIDTETWELAVDAARQGNYRRDAHNILFIGGPGNLPDLLFGNGFE